MDFPLIPSRSSVLAWLVSMRNSSQRTSCSSAEPARIGASDIIR